MAVPVYGVNTGFGKFASVRLAPEDAMAQQRNLVHSHCRGVGAPTPEPIVRLTMALKLILFGRARLCGNGGTITSIDSQTGEVGVDIHLKNENDEVTSPGSAVVRFRIN